mmetsp:Transcript_593/g.1184  ORF Transcript_593/g.1184 Transcript_593/m.1184 type:complete len:315 (-) Transcript_593:271-1215(-)|eukprot:CAMPEP_0172658132 /NCGR_PEP_ID=MMETSP1074-20121228/2572_1 /TAXON_ID=2916 /ORGANISM="Ceratium fusus, Strain PA161109" /LENGTH=314 /DNA_ID=CAMNT_0013473371 /DNA_START=64 /DNA_END=1008 /DNA_ORIENTATION=+
MEAPKKLIVSIIRAEGLKHMNKFTGDHPYVRCEGKRANGEVAAKAETKPVTVGDTLNPVWDETMELEPWQPGEMLEFTVYDKGLLGSKTEGKAQLPSEFFYPNGFQGMLGIIGLPEARLCVDVQVEGAEREPSPEQEPAPMTYGAPEASMGGSRSVPQRLGVSILQAHGLQHMNNFTGDKPYVTCEVKRADSAVVETRVETKPVAEGDTLNPFWGETHNVEPWCEGESLEFTVYDQGLLGSKTEGKAVLPSDLFYPQGFSGMLLISGLPHALLHVIVRPLGPSVVLGETLVDPDASKKKKKKKVKVGKKSKNCC